MFLQRFVSAVALVSVLSAAQAAPTSLKPIVAANLALPAAPQLKDEDFSRRSRLREVKLSPDGAWIAYFESGEKNASLKVLDVATGEKKQLLADIGRAQLHWSTDSQALFVDTGEALSVVGVKDGVSTRIAAFDRKLQQQFIDVDVRRPRHALVSEFDAAAKRYRLSRIGADGAGEVLYEGPKKLIDFLIDGAGQVSFIHTLDDDYRHLVSRKQDAKWTETLRCKRLQSCQLVSASNDGRVLTMVLNEADDRKSLVQLDMPGGRRKVLHADPDALADLSQVKLSPRTGEPLFAVYDAPRRHNFGLTAPAKQAAGDIARRFQDASISVSASEDALRWLLTERSARLTQERFWLYDRKARSFQQVFEQERALGNPVPEQHLARKSALDYRASDGVIVHGYLSLPPGKDAAKVPMLTMVHGGPWGAFENDYQSLVQMLVNRGFAVFQPNFRSSTGYGDKYMLAPQSDFGNGRVQADIIEGVRWLAANGVGDKNRLAIMGDSFGGYSTLQALTHTPQLFQFGMATVAPTDFGRTMRNAAGGPGTQGDLPLALHLREVGVDLNDAAAMKRVTDSSPAANAGKVTRPLMMIAGAKDPMVDIAAITDYVATLQAGGKPVSLLVAPDEGHNLRKPLTRQAYLYLLMKMLEQHLGGPAVPAPDTELAKFLEQTMKANGALPATAQKVALGQ